ncbi:Na+/H+ antiporter subunit D [Fictibacillus enclensis]|uniref:Na+/H+ antiporter subunit D n=1 Tax=Fictibacillus enclensis TaxID=1017270 RepID=UPI0024BF2734|nr:Na+/H+ antiporter subunit D [Fictibacillus enclensis]WHY70520.1 Na+/H+ antiporter subunit D [Fictibacillus enclensis]
MSNLVILPILIPLFFGAMFIFFHNKLATVRLLSFVVLLINTATAVFIVYEVFSKGALILETGGWKAPYGIILIADKLSSLLILTTNIIALAACWYAGATLDEEREKHYFYTLFLILIAGVSGAFLTGDLFNLFVFFEVLLMASYGLIVLGATKIQLRESIKYVLLNLFSSMLFVTTVAFLYSVTGTVNMAQLAERVGDVQQKGVLTAIAILLFVVFATKGALFPLYFWLPKSYTAPPPVISALFGALLTKVGIYSILRVFSLIFIYKLETTHTFFVVLAGFTLVFGVIGALSTHNVKLIIAYNIIPAIGFMILGIGTFSSESLAGTIYYLVHDMIIKAALFFLAGILVYIAGTSDLRQMGGYIKKYPLVGWMFFLSALVLAGIPPFSGFIGKLLLLKGAFAEKHYMIAAIGLGCSLLILLSIIRIFIMAFWGEQKEVKRIKLKPGMVIPPLALLCFSIFLGIGAEWIYPHIQSIADGLANPSEYINEVLKAR